MKPVLIIITAIISIMTSLNAQTSNNQRADSDSTKKFGIANKWSIYQGDNNGNPMFIRKNNGCDTFVGNKTYSTRCGIALKFLFPADNGLPQMAKEPELNNIEEDIFAVFQSDLNSLVTIIITTSGFREYVLYTNDIHKFEKRLKKLKAKYRQYPISSYIEKDEEWEIYKSYGK